MLHRFGKSFARIACFLLALCIVNAYAESPSYEEYTIKAAFLYNFAKFVKWPKAADSSTDGDLTICILGSDPFGTLLDSIQGRSLKGRRVVVKRVQSGVTLEPCDILFVSSSEEGRLGEILSTLNGSNTLTVGETEGFAELGGMVNLVLEEGNVRMEINVDAAEQAGLKISARLLKISKIVTPRHAEETN